MVLFRPPGWPILGKIFLTGNVPGRARVVWKQSAGPASPQPKCLAPPRFLRPRPPDSAPQRRGRQTDSAQREHGQRRRFGENEGEHASVAAYIQRVRRLGDPSRSAVLGHSIKRQSIGAGRQAAEGIGAVGAREGVQRREGATGRRDAEDGAGTELPP